MITPKFLINVYIMLLALLFLTITVAYFNFGFFNPILAMSIAIIKTVLIIFYFMEVRYRSQLTWIFASAGFVWLSIMLIFTMTDYLFRSWLE